MEQTSRDIVVSKLRGELLGPAGGRYETLKGKPYWRYLCGMLFPQDVDAATLGVDDEGETDGADSDEDHSDSAIQQAYESLPSSMGVSFFLGAGERLRVRPEAAKYVEVEPADPGEVEPGRAKKGSEPGCQDKREKRVRGAEVWQRRPLADGTAPLEVELACPAPNAAGHVEKRIWDRTVSIRAHFRPLRSGHLVTVSMVNEQSQSRGARASQVEKTLFQCRFEVVVDQGWIGEYPTVARFARHQEDEELALAYRSRKTFGVGHGCAAVWERELEGERIDCIGAEPVPAYEVRGLTNEISLPERARRVLSLRWLADPDRSPEEIEVGFREFLGAYASWIEEQEESAERLPESDRAVARRITERQRRALGRMETGVEALLDPRDPDALAAFRIAQEAMLRQFLWRSRTTVPVDRGFGQVTEPNPWDIDIGHGPQWRPFQLAFQLLVVPSLLDPACKDREVLDLLWFPTGGGKTEAYLALAAFEIASRRRRYGPGGGGTCVFMRYTLRLLTSQQFERAATLVSVLETMRRRDAALRLGEEPIRLGLWVGGSTTPNRLDQDSEGSPGAVQILEAVLEADVPENPFQLRACPLCGTRLVPERKSRREDYGIEVSSGAFRMFCPDSNCGLHERIPVSVVDEDLYQRPPTFLVGTIDKFARMVWMAEPRFLLGCGEPEVLPPSLVIQDELHLITGPLGTIAGLYEAGIDTVIRRRGPAPKYIAATATIQRSVEQCRALFAREADVFPPGGLDASDSFFSREDTTGPGRTFIGVMGSGLYSSLTSLVQVSAAAAAAPVAIPSTEVLERDTYWTQVVYHNSRQELGKTTTMLRDDVRSRLEILQEGAPEARDFDRVEELSANLKGAEVAEALERLQAGLVNDQERVVDAVACTNMISVGVDVPRLGLMIVKSQPKSTAEYIQATSRVGRDARRPAGVVVALYASARPRDRSHYESFQSYHQALYRAVEPASVTPFSPPARERALHAGLVLAIRSLLAWEEPRAASRFDAAAPEIESILGELRRRLTAACRSDEVKATMAHLEELVEQWSREAPARGRPDLTFADEKQYRRLLSAFPSEGEEPEGLWPTLNSMRHVDGEVRIRPRGEGNAR